MLTSAPTPPGTSKAFWDDGAPPGSLRRKNSKLSATFDSIRLEVCVIHGEDRSQHFPLRQIHQGGIREVHGTTPVARHQGCDLRQFRIFDRRHRIALERRNFRLACISWRLSPTKWNHSVSTASDVSSGNRSCWNVSVQSPCQRSDRSSSARIAPVSIRASAAMALPQSLPDCLPCILRTVCVAAVQCAEAPRCRLVEAPLLVVALVRRSVTH